MDSELPTCILCSRPLRPGSVDGVCGVCAHTQEFRVQQGETPRPEVTVGPVAHIRESNAPADAPLPPNPPGLVLVRRLGAGGMGAVYLALDAETRRFVAVKLLHAPGDRASVDRFQAEVRALAELDHPNIVTVFAADLHSHPPYFTMEHVPGGTLARFVSTYGPLDPRGAAVLIATIARAAHAAHKRGIVHRDIKPGNVLLGGIAPISDSKPVRDERVPAISEFTPKLSDFGLAKRTDRNDGLTATAGVVGTPGFMSPEQAAGETVTHRTDVYGLGATLYHALTGSPPSGPAPGSVRWVEPTRVRLLRPDVPVELEAIVHKCLDRNPAARYATAEDLAADLGRFAAGEPVLAKPLTPLRRALKAAVRKRGWLARVAVAALALVAAAAAGASAGNNRPRSEQETPSLPGPLQEVQDELSAGRPVMLVGPTGEPLWHQWVKGRSAFIRADQREQACAFQGAELSMLDLCSDPMTARYSVRAELAQIDVRGVNPDGQLPTGGVYQVGLYFGRQTSRGNDGWQVERCLAVRFTEAPWAKRDTPHANFGRLMTTEAPIQRPQVSRVSTRSTPIVPAAALPGAWRVIEVEVTPERVKAWLGNSDGTRTLFVDESPDTIAGLYGTRNTAFDRLHPNHGVPVPAWNPRGALGVWAESSSVAIRNVTVTPIK